VSPVKYELGFYIPEDAILHSHCRRNLRSHGSIITKCVVRDTRVLLTLLYQRSSAETRNEHPRI
jgi:hypothetical protein